MNILILQLKRIGDAILTAPALAALRKALPDARITLMLSGVTAELGPAFSMVDEVVKIQQGKPNFSAWKRAATGKFDACLDFTGNDRSAALAIASRAKWRVGYAKFTRNFIRKRCLNKLCHASVRDLHTIDFHHELVNEALGAITGTKIPGQLPKVPDFGHLTIPPGLNIPDLPPQFALLHPGTARVEKYWPADRWKSVAAQLLPNLPVVITGSKDAYEQSQLALMHDGCLDLSGKLTLLETMAVVSKSEIALGVDSAAMHMASSFQKPQIVLFGPTNPYHWRPRHHFAKVLVAGAEPGSPVTPKMPPAPMADLPLADVIQALDALLPCPGQAIQPCGE